MCMCICVNCQLVGEERRAKVTCMNAVTLLCLEEVEVRTHIYERCAVVNDKEGGTERESERARERERERERERD